MLLRELQEGFSFAGFDSGRVVVAVSGGRDSVALLKCVELFTRESSVEIIVAHFDHRLRESSAGDRLFVNELSGQLGLRCISAEVDEQFSGGENVEAWAREKRYQFLEQVRSEQGASLILTAHHRDDECETILFRLLSGRLATRARGVSRFDSVRRVLRPWLAVPRSAIEEFILEHSLSYREDETNLDPGRTRNRLRHELIPQLEEQYNPNLKSSLSELSQRLTEDEELLWEEARGLAKQLQQCWEEGRFCSLPAPIRWRVLAFLVSPQERELGYRKLKILENRILRSDGEEFFLDLGSGVRVGYKRGQGLASQLYFHR